jgi:cyanate permease
MLKLTPRHSGLTEERAADVSAFVHSRSSAFRPQHSPSKALHSRARSGSFISGSVWSWASATPRSGACGARHCLAAGFRHNASVSRSQWSGLPRAIVLPLAQHLITTGGWRHAYRVFALVAAAFIPLLLLLPWRRIERGAPGLVPLHVTTGKGTSSVRDAVREWPFWSLSLAFGITSVGTFSIAPQAMAYLLEHGVDSAYAARALAVAGLLTPLGMIGFSWFADRGGRKVAALVAYACSMLGVVALALVRGPGDEFWLWLYVVLFGGSMGSRGPMISTLATLRYRGAHFGRIYGLIGISVGLGGFLGAWIGGLLHDWTHGYTALMIFALAAFVFAAVLLSAEAGARDQLAAAPLRHLK